MAVLSVKRTQLIAVTKEPLVSDWFPARKCSPGKNFKVSSDKLQLELAESFECKERKIMNSCKSVRCLAINLL